MGAWVLSRYVHVEAALRDARLAVHGAPVAAPTVAAHTRTLRAEPFSPAMTALMQREADRLLQTLFARVHAPDSIPGNPTAAEPWDLLPHVIRPWCATLAQGYARIDDDTMARCVPYADEVFRHAAIATSGVPQPASVAAVSALAQALGAGSGDGEHAALRVQAFVALVASLPCVIAGAWWLLLQQPHQWVAADLLRAASPTQAVFREARATCVYGDAVVQRGDRVVLMLRLADHDGDVTGRAPLTFGGGDHRCVGAGVVQQAVRVLTARWEASHTTHAVQLHPQHPPAWQGGFALRGLASLPVTIRQLDAHTP